MLESLDIIGHFIEKFGVSLFIALWFMFRHEKSNARLTNRVNKLIITTVVIAKTLDLDEEQDRLIRAASDEDSGEKKLPTGG